MLSRFLSLLITLPLALAASLCLLAYASLEPLPLVESFTSASHGDVRALRDALGGQSPSGLQAGQQGRLVLDEREMDLLLSQAGYRMLKAHSRYRLTQGKLRGEMTWRLSLSSASPYLNMSFVISEAMGKPKLESFALGRFALSLDMETRYLADIIALAISREELSLLHAKVERLLLDDDRMELVYRWDPAIIEQARDLVMDEADQERAGIYVRALKQTLTQRPRALHELLQPIFRLAANRSVSGDPVAENRAAITALGFYALGSQAGELLRDGEAVMPLVTHWVRLRGREDLSRHFLVSAAIAAGSDSGLSDAVGVYKEWSDSQGGSGFSFIDLAADRAGTRFGERATRSPALARKIQDMLSERIDDSSLLPPVSDLPENLSDRSIMESFGGIGGKRYRRMTEIIERRLDSMPLYRVR